MTILLLFCLASSSVEHEIHIDFNKLTISYDNEYAKLRLPGYDLSDLVGAPEVLAKPLIIALPYGAQVTGLEIIEQESRELADKLLLSCVQPPVILSQTDIPYVMPKPEIYGSMEPYPKRILELVATTMVDGYSLAEILFYPVQYLPGMKKVRVFTRVRFVVHYEGGSLHQARHGMVQKLVANPEVVRVDNTYSGYGFEYVIITAPPLDTVFERLAAWKTKKGMRAVVRTLSWIKSRYSGEDDAARVRNYLKTVIDSGAVYVLLGGDTDILPHRRAYAMCCEAGSHPREDSLPCDSYFGDLDGTWDENDNHVYGEVADSINLYPDLLVGRAPVSSIAQAQKFVEKVLRYERNPEVAYLDNALLAADILWTNPYTDQAVHKNNIDDESFPEYFEIRKLYQSQGNSSPDAFKAELRLGKGLINHDGHAGTGSMHVGTGNIVKPDFDTLTNAPRYGILYSIGCWTTAFDYDAIAEHFVNSPQGGGIAFIGNSSYGWGSPGNPGFGYSDRFDNRFFYSLLKENAVKLGAALSLAKAYFIPYSHEENVYRWHQYQLNLMGDPALCVWTAQPETLLVSAPQSISLGASSALISVRDQATGIPVQDALVCLMKGAESYAAGCTDASGQIFLNVTPATLGNCDLTVTAHNYLPVETTLPVIHGSYVSYYGWTVNDSLGNNDAIANPGEDIFLTTIVKNTGTAAAQHICINLRAQDSAVVIQDSTAFLEYLLPGDSAIIHNAFRIVVGATSNGHGICFELEIDETAQWLYYYPILLVGTPLMSLDAMYIHHPPTLAGEVESLYVSLSNTGFGYGHATYAYLMSPDPYVTMFVDSVWYGEIPPESEAIAQMPFVFLIDETCPSLYSAPLAFTITCASAVFTDTTQLLIGNAGFQDIMESGSELWTTGGANNLWHISTRRSLSPTHAWYCGDSVGGNYVNNMNCYIQSPSFVLPPNSILSFYRWFDVPIYGADGMYVIVLGNGFADTLDFIGTGGALDPENTRQGGIQSDWSEERYSLSAYPAGDSIQVRFAFISNSDSKIGEGFYIDNIRIATQTEVAPEAPYITHATKSGDDVAIVWHKVITDTLNNPEHVSYYVVYRDTFPSFVPEPSDSIGVVLHPDTVYCDQGILSMSHNYYYLVMAVDWLGNLSKPSNMAFVCHKFLNANSDRASRNWLSLPWYSNYEFVSDMTDDLSPAGDPLVKVTNLIDDQKYESWLWDPDFTEWYGTNFKIRSGRAYECVAAHDDTLVLVGSNNPNGLVVLNENPDALDRNWISLPYDAVYTNASDITNDYSPQGNPLTKLTTLRDDQRYESWLWDPDFGEWYGNDFSLEIARGYEFVPIVDTVWNPTEYGNEQGGYTLTRTRTENRSEMRIGTSVLSERAPSWLTAASRSELLTQDGKSDMPIALIYPRQEADISNRSTSHVVRAHIEIDAMEGIVFAAYRPSLPNDVLTEKIVGCGVARSGCQAVIWFDVGNFELPWHDGEQIIMLVEALDKGCGYFTTVDFTLNGNTDIQDLETLRLMPIPVPQRTGTMVHWAEIEDENIIGYSIYDGDTRLNSVMLRDCEYRTDEDPSVRPVVVGGYETVYGSRECIGNGEVLVEYGFTVNPNPFTSSTCFEYGVAERSTVEIAVYDVAGRLVKTMVHGIQNPGYYSLGWDGSDEHGRNLSAGVYFARFTAGTSRIEEKVLLVK